MPRRNWTHARHKAETEGCRICGARAECAHIIGRESDYFTTGAVRRRYPQGTTLTVEPERIIPLCAHHHQGPQGYDARRLDVLSLLTVPEQAQAVLDAGGIENARMRLAPSEYRAVAA